MKKICVNEEQCIGCGACVAIDSEHFDFNDSGLTLLKKHDKTSKKWVFEIIFKIINISYEICAGSNNSN